jgi:hypothetical protein
MSRHGGRLTLVFSDAEQLQGMLEKLEIAL